MPKDSKIGRLTVDLQADSSALKKGMNSAKDIVGKGVDGMKSSIDSVKGAIAAAGAAMAVFGGMKALSDHQRDLVNLNNTVKQFANGYKKSMSEVAKFNADFAKNFGTTAIDMDKARLKLNQMLAGSMSMDQIDEIMLPIVFEYQAQNPEKEIQDAAQDIVEAWNGEPPDEMQTAIKNWLQKGFNVDWDSLTADERKKWARKFVMTFKGASKEAQSTMGGAMDRLKNAFSQVFISLSMNKDTAKFAETLNKLADILYDFSANLQTKGLKESLIEVKDRIVDMISEATGLDDATIEKWGKWGAILAGLALAAKPLGTLASAISGVGNLGISFGQLLWKGFQAVGFGALFGWVWKMIGSGLSWLGGMVLKGILGLMAPIDLAIMGLRGPIGSAIGDLWSFIAALWIEGPTKFIANFKSLFAELPTLLGGIFEGVAAAVGVSVGTLVAIIVAIIAVVVAFVVAWKNNWGGLRDNTIEVWNSIVSFFSDLYQNNLLPLFESLKELFWTLLNAIFEVFKAILEALGIDVPQFEEFMAMVAAAAVLLFQHFKEILPALKDFIGYIFSDIIKALGENVKFIGDLFGLIVDVIKFAADLISAILQTLVAIIHGDFSAIDDIWTWFGTKTKETFANIAILLLDAVERITNILLTGSGYIGQIFATLTGHGEEYRKSQEEWKKNVANTFEGWKNDVKASMSQNESDTKAWASNTGANLADGKGQVNTQLTDMNAIVSSQFNTTTTTVNSKTGEMVDAISSAAPRFKVAGNGLISAMKEGFMDKIDSLVDLIKKKMGEIRDLLPGSNAKKGPLHTLTRAGRGFVTAMQDGFDHVAPGFVKHIEDTAGKLSDAWSPQGSLALGVPSGYNYGGSSNNTTIVNVNGGTFASDRDMNRLVSRIDAELGKRYDK